MLGPHPAIRGPLPKVTPLLLSALRELGCEIELQPWGRRREHEPLRTKVAQRAADIVRVRRALRRQPVDVLVIKTAHDWATLSRDIPLLLAVRALCPRVVLQFHGSACDRLVAPGHVPFKVASAWLLRLCDAALVLSCQEQRQWQTFWPSGRFHRVSNPFLPPVAAQPLPTRQQLGLPPDGCVVLFVGRLIEAKGIREVIAALPTVLGQVPFHLLVVGDGPLERTLRRDAADAGVAERLTFAGYLQGEALQAAYHCADVFVLPTWWAEGFPLAIVEAMGAGLPLITTPIRGMADHLGEGVNTLFVPPRDRAALAAALTRLLGDHQLRTQMGQANREKVREFAPDVVARHYLDVLRSVVADRAIGGTAARVA